MIVFETLGRRWFAFAFIAALVWAAWPEGGWRRALRFWAIAAVCSFLAEYSSTHTGFPYGDYSYVAETRGQELYLSNIPLFVPLSFGSVVLAGRALVLGTRLARTPVTLAIAGGALATLMDFAIDPMTLHGEQWFMGSLYTYGAEGWWFGVPWSNFGGWLLVSAVIILLDDLLGRRGVLGTSGGAARAPRASFERGRALALGICGFFVALGVATVSWPETAGIIAVSALIAAIAFLVPRTFTASPEPARPRGPS